MKIRVLFFAQLREIFNASEKDFEVKEGTTIQGFVDELKNQGYEQLGKISLSYAINESWTKAGETLKSGDQLALLPPVAGG